MSIRHWRGAKWGRERLLERGAPLDRAAVRPRELLRQRLLHEAAAVTFAHQQPLCCAAGVTSGSADIQFEPGWRR